MTLGARSRRRNAVIQQSNSHFLPSTSVGAATYETIVSLLNRNTEMRAHFAAASASAAAYNTQPPTRTHLIKSRLSVAPEPRMARVTTTQRQHTIFARLPLRARLPFLPSAQQQQRACNIARYARTRPRACRSHTIHTIFHPEISTQHALCTLARALARIIPPPPSRICEHMRIASTTIALLSPYGHQHLPKTYTYTQPANVCAWCVTYRRTRNPIRHRTRARLLAHAGGVVVVAGCVHGTQAVSWPHCRLDATRPTGHHHASEPFVVLVLVLGGRLPHACMRFMNCERALFYMLRSRQC